MVTDMSLGGSSEPATTTSTILKLNSSDPAWEWGECRDPTKKHNVWCKLCDKKFGGGISRLKAHLLGIKGNCTACPSATIEIQKKIQVSLDETKKKKAEKARVRSILEEQYEDDTDSIIEEQETIDFNANVGPNKKKKHTNVRGPLDLIMEKTKQSSLDDTNPHKQALKKIAWKKFCKWGYEVGLPFNAVRTSSFDDMVHAIGDYGRGMPPPSYHHYRVTLLKEVFDEEKPCMGYIYEAMSRAKDTIEKNLGNDHRTCARVWSIIDNRWIDQLHRPLHAAGYYLNPSIYFKQPQTQIETNSVVKTGLFKTMERLISESEIDIAMDQLRNYRDATGAFGMKSAISRRDKMQPYEWWMQYGSDTPILTKFAIRVLSQTCSASPCERNWSAFDHLHSKRRNCLHQQKLNHLVYIQYNQKLERGFKERLVDGKSDPIILKEIDECDEWIIPSEEELQDSVAEGDDLTLERVHSTRNEDQNEGPNTRSRVRRTLFVDDDNEEDQNLDVELEIGELVGQDLEEDEEDAGSIDIDI